MPTPFHLNRILAATDLSARSDRAVRRAALLARRAGATLTLLHAVDDEQPPSLAQLEQHEAERLLHAQVAGLPELDGMHLAARVELGDPHAVILHAAEATDADLLVLGEHRRRPLRDWFIGTTVERVVRRGRRPVLLVHQPAAGPYRRVLVATDFSATSARALRAALGMGLLEAAEVTLLHAHEGPAMQGIGLANLPEPEARAQVEAAAAGARRRLEDFAGEFALERAPLLVVEEGRPGHVIGQVVERRRPELVVVGTAGAGLLRQSLLGSVAAEVLGGLACDVLAVPHGEPG